MLSAIKLYFSERISVVDDTVGNEQTIHRATAVLLAEMMRMDGDIREEEREVIRAALYKHFGLDESEIDTILSLAEQQAEESHDYYQFTSLINTHFSNEQKIEVIESLWRIAYADKVLNKYEEHLLRKVSGLLYVSHRDYIAAKLRIQKETGI